MSLEWNPLNSCLIVEWTRRLLKRYINIICFQDLIDGVVSFLLGHYL